MEKALSREREQDRESGGLSSSHSSTSTWLSELEQVPGLDFGIFNRLGVPGGLWTFADDHKGKYP
jgi:hypothetical protein